MSLPRPRHLVLLLALSLSLVAALALSACGAADKVADAADPVEEALAATQKAEGARFTMRMGFAGTGIPASASMTADGVVDMQKGNAQLTMDLGALAAAVAQQGAPAPGDLKMELRVVDRRLYLRGGILGAELPAGKSWIGIDLEKAAEQLGIDSSQFTQLSDPTAVLESLRDAGSVKKTGTATIDGVETTRYRARIDLDKALAALGSSEGSQGAQMRDLMKGVLPPDGLPVDVWIGDDGLLRRMELRFTLGEGTSQLSAAGSFGMTMRLDLSDYGTKVNVEAPPASDVADGSELLGFGGSQTP